MGFRHLAIVAAVTVAAGLDTASAHAQSQPSVGDAGAAEMLAAGNYSAAIDLLRQRADDGDTQAQIMLADLYLGGLGTDRNIHAAIAWLQQAAIGGNVHAMVRLGAMYRDMGPAISGVMPQELWPVAAGWFIMAADAGSAEGAFQAGYVFSTGLVSDHTEWLTEEAEDALALRYLERAVAMGHGPAGWHLAMTDRDAPDFVDHVRAAADGIDGVRAQAMLATYSGLADQLTPRERYFWALVTLYNAELTGNERMLPGGSTEDLAAAIADLAATLDPADRTDAETEAADFVSDWIDPYP